MLYPLTATLAAHKPEVIFIAAFLNAFALAYPVFYVFAILAFREDPPNRRPPSGTATP